MKKQFSLIFIILASFVFQLQATCCDREPGPFDILLRYNLISDADFEKSKLDDQSVKYSQGDLETNCVVYYDEECEEGLALFLAYRNTQIRWDENPFFDKTYFHSLRVGLGGLSNRLGDWLWRGRFIFNVDVDHWKWDYVTYDMFFWGRYDYRSDLGVHIGLYAFTGMRIDHVYPIIGVDWHVCNKWQLNLIFPMDISAVYSISDKWSAALAWRPFYSRHRAGSHEPLPEALAYYRNHGIELGLNYDSAGWFTANLHGGMATGGKLKIADRNYRNKKHFKFKSSGYLGGELSANF